MMRSLSSLSVLALMSAPVAAADGGGVGGFSLTTVAQTLVAVALLVLLARGTAGEEQDDTRRARGRGLLSSLSSGSW